jgi:hypothetical protein
MRILKKIESIVSYIEKDVKKEKCKLSILVIGKIRKK